MFKEFKEFALKGSLLDLAVGFILGGAFSKLVTSMVADIMMPPIGMLLGKLDFSNLFLSLSGASYASLAAAKAAGAATLNYGLFVNQVIDFTIVAFVLFLIIRQVNKLKRQTEPVAPNTKECPFCYSTVAVKATRCAHCTSELK
jgi:large conductance mechanosensitive channel